MHRLLVLGATTFALAFGSVTPVAAVPPGLIEQELCDPGGTCQHFSDLDPIGITRAFTFTLPTRARVQVSFQGALRCESTGASGGRGYVGSTSQIVLSPTVAANPGGPAGLRHVMRFAPASVNEHSALQHTVNLASLRAFKAATPGPKTVYFRLTRIKMDRVSFCSVYNAAFTVLYLPY